MSEATTPTESSPETSGVKKKKPKVNSAPVPDPTPADALIEAVEQAATEFVGDRVPETADTKTPELIQDEEDSLVDTTGMVATTAPLPPKTADGQDFFAFRPHYFVYDHARCASRVSCRGKLIRIDQVVLGGMSHFILILENTAPTLVVDPSTMKLRRVEASTPNAVSQIAVPWPGNVDALRDLLTPAFFAEIELRGHPSGYHVFVNPQRIRKNLGGQ